MKEKARALVRDSVLRSNLRPIVGLGLVSVLAVIAGRVFAGKPDGIFLPLGFVLVLFALAMRYGVVVGVAGSLLTAIIFSHLLFSPIGNWQVESQLARQNIAWMILGSVVLSYLFVPGRRRRPGK